MSYGDPAPGGAPRPLHTGSAVTFITRARGGRGPIPTCNGAPQLSRPLVPAHISLLRHDMLRCDRKPAAHTMVWGSFLQANTLHERPHQPASITPHSGIEERTPPQSFMGTSTFMVMDVVPQVSRIGDQG